MRIYDQKITHISNVDFDHLLSTFSQFLVSTPVQMFIDDLKSEEIKTIISEEFLHTLSFSGMAARRKTLGENKFLNHFSVHSSKEQTEELLSIDIHQYFNEERNQFSRFVSADTDVYTEFKKYLAELSIPIPSDFVKLFITALDALDGAPKLTLYNGVTYLGENPSFLCTFFSKDQNTRWRTYKLKINFSSFINKEKNDGAFSVAE